MIYFYIFYISFALETLLVFLVNLNAVACSWLFTCSLAIFELLLRLLQIMYIKPLMLYLLMLILWPSLQLVSWPFRYMNYFYPLLFYFIRVCVCVAMLWDCLHKYNNPACIESVGFQMPIWTSCWWQCNLMEHGFKAHNRKVLELIGYS